MLRSGRLTHSPPRPLPEHPLYKDSAVNILTGSRSFQHLSAGFLAACLLAGASGAQAGTDAEEDADSPEVLCMALPRVAISNGDAVVSAFSETLREQVAALVSGPLVEARSMTSRLPVQVRAEAQQEGCRYLLNVTFSHHPQSRIGKRSAETAVTVGAAASQLGAMSSSASGALGAASTISGLFGRGRDDGGSSGSGLYPLGKNDRVGLAYTLEPVGKQQPAEPRSGQFAGKAAKDNDPQVEQLIEKAATAVLETLLANPQVAK